MKVRIFILLAGLFFLTFAGDCDSDAETQRFGYEAKGDSTTMTGVDEQGNAASRTFENNDSEEHAKAYKEIRQELDEKKGK